jgi:hypothetical protein
MTRQEQVKLLETELRLPITPARRKDLAGMLAYARHLLKQGR